MRLIILLVADDVTVCRSVRPRSLHNERRSIKGFIHEASLDSTLPATCRPSLVVCVRLVCGLCVFPRRQVDSNCYLIKRERSSRSLRRSVSRSRSTWDNLLEMIYDVLSLGALVIKWIIAAHYAHILRLAWLASSPNSIFVYLFAFNWFTSGERERKTFNPFALDGTRKKQLFVWFDLISMLASIARVHVCLERGR